MINIARFLDGITLARVAEVCKEWYKIAQTEDISFCN
jgi:hypothetical protein